MGALLEIVGWLILLAVLVVLILIAVNARDTISIWVILTWALPSLFGAILIIAFGQVVSHLKAMRDQAEKQTLLLGDLLRSQKKIEPIFGRDDA